VEHSASIEGVFVKIYVKISSKTSSQNSPSVKSTWYTRITDTILADLRNYYAFYEIKKKIRGTIKEAKEIVDLTVCRHMHSIRMHKFDIK